MVQVVPEQEDRGDVQDWNVRVAQVVQVDQEAPKVHLGDEAQVVQEVILKDGAQVVLVD